MSAEEREKIKAERRAGEAGKSVAGSSEGGEDKPKKMSAEERQRIKAERRPRGRPVSLKNPASAESKEPPEVESEGEAKKKG